MLYCQPIVKFIIDTHQSLCTSYLTQTTFVAVQSLCIELLNHETQSKCAYQATVIVLLDECNGISVVKLGKLSIYCLNLHVYKVERTSSFDIINETFHTALEMPVFLK